MEGLPGDPHDDGGGLCTIINNAPVLPRSSQKAFLQSELIKDRKRAQSQKVYNPLANTMDIRHRKRQRQRQTETETSVSLDVEIRSLVGIGNGSV